MDSQNLDEKLQQLSSELKKIELVDDNERQMLRQLMTEIQLLLDQTEDHSSHGREGLGERLKESIEKFEAAHPTATAARSQAIEVVRNMGI